MTAAEADARRLVAALEEFTEQQAFSLSVGNAVHAVELQRRAAPLIQRLCELAAREPDLTRAIGVRLDSLFAARRNLQRRLAVRREQVITRRRQIAESRQRLQELAPAYGARLAAVPTRLSARA
jgi:hypothetical protein